MVAKVAVVYREANVPRDKSEATQPRGRAYPRDVLGEAHWARTIWWRAIPWATSLGCGFQPKIMCRAGVVDDGKLRQLARNYSSELFHSTLQPREAVGRLEQVAIPRGDPKYL